MKKVFFALALIMILTYIPGSIKANAADDAERSVEFELTGSETDIFLSALSNPDTRWSSSSLVDESGRIYFIGPSYVKGDTVFGKAPGGGISVSGRSEYWHALDIRHWWMQPDYEYDIEVSFSSDVPTVFAITDIPGLEVPDEQILAISLEPATEAVLTYTLSNDNRTGGQRGVRLIAMDEDVDFTVTGIRIYEGYIYLFPWWIIQLVLGIAAAAFIAYIVIRAVQVEKFRQKLPDRIFVVCNTVFMLFIMVVMLYPFLNVLAISFNNPQDSIRGNIYLWPRIFTFANYEQVFKNQNLVTAFVNSVMRTVISTVGGLLVCSMAAYVLSRREFMMGKFVTMFFLLTMYISAGLIPTYFLYRDLGLVNNFNVYWVPGLFGAFNVIVIRTYIQGLPDSLVEAGRLDGAGEFRIFAQIILPICKPVLATVGLWIAVGNWNDWFTSFIYAPFNKELTTLQYELMKELSNTLAQMGQQASEFVAMQGDLSDFEAVTPIAIRSAITIVATVPILVVYPFLQKYFVKGVHVGSVKG